MSEWPGPGLGVPGPSIRLSLNVDHVATLRNARGGEHPDPVRAAQVAIAAGADGVTAHLREDRRHIRDDDIYRLNGEIDAPLNLEMAAVPDMLSLAVNLRPAWVCLVPEKREELTTEGGLDVTANPEALTAYVRELRAAGVQVTLFVDPETPQIDAAAAIGASAVELHTGTYCNAFEAALHGKPAAGPRPEDELERLNAAAFHAQSLALELHAGHGLTFDTVGPVAALPGLSEVSIGHFMVAEALFRGLPETIQEMRERITMARVVSGGGMSGETGGSLLQ
jgi:pyridoxine 5-phosphate synthase